MTLPGSTQMNRSGCAESGAAGTGAAPVAARRTTGGTPPKSARRRARELALQGLYQWLLSREDSGAIHAHLTDTPGYAKADQEHLDALLHGAIRAVDELETCIGPALDRPLNELSPVERAVLMLATFELLRMPEIPYRVVLNEAIEIAKVYGGSDGFRYVNGVLDRVAAQLRPLEVAQRAQDRTGDA